MTHNECVTELKKHPQQAVVLAVVAQVSEIVVSNCDEDSLLGCVWALDSARRWALGLAEKEEVEAAADIVDTSDAAYTADAAYAAAYTAGAAAAAANAAAYDATAFAADAAATARKQLVTRLGEPRKTLAEYLANDNGQLLPREWMSPEQLVTLDEILEAA